LKLDGSKPIRLTTSKDAESSPTFSPDGRTVAYVARRGTESKIELMDADGKNSRRLTKTAGEEFEPCFSPDGAAIAFDSSKSGLSSDIYQVDLTSGAETRLTSDSGDERVPLYSPNGTEIAYTTVINKGTFVMNRDGSNPVKLIPNGYATSWK
jgi:Tol biopolymer transport system component